MWRGWPHCGITTTNWRNATPGWNVQCEHQVQRVPAHEERPQEREVSTIGAGRGWAGHGQKGCSDARRSLPQQRSPFFQGEGRHDQERYRFWNLKPARYSPDTGQSRIGFTGVRGSRVAKNGSWHWWGGIQHAQRTGPQSGRRRKPSRPGLRGPYVVQGSGTVSHITRSD